MITIEFTAGIILGFYTAIIGIIFMIAYYISNKK
jgi:hypothetical protein